jgi:lipoprotein signal peptidase
MIVLLTSIAVLVADLALKTLLRRRIGTDAISLGAVGTIQVVEGRLWLQQMRGGPSQPLLWSLWTTAAVALLIASSWMALSPLYAGLLLGGSLANAIEHTQRGAVSDYICLRFWPAFNLADAAVAVGAAGILIEVALTLRGAA